MLSAILAGIGLGLDLWGQYSQKRAVERAAGFNAVVDELNREAARAATDWAIARHRYDVRKLLGTQRARYAAAGVRLEGTPLLVMQESAAQAELDEIAMRYWGQLRQARFQNQAAMARYGGKTWGQAAKIGLFGTLLTEGPKVAKKFGFKIG